MVISSDDLREWSDFPKGLRVLLLDEDGHDAAELKSTLEGMDYIVSTYYNENEALEAISNKVESFHVAIVEVSTSNIHGSFRFLESARDLPTIMISNIYCLSTMMKCIALGATEFLQKPVSEEMLKNIWQHVVHKAFNAGESILSKSLKPIKETVASMLQLQPETAQEEKQNPSEEENGTHADKLDHKPSLSNDRFPAPSTPQLEQGGRLLDDGDCQDQTNWLIDKETREQDGVSMELRIPSCSESKSVENTCENSASAVASLMENLPSRPEDATVEEEVDSAGICMFDKCNIVKDCNVSSYSQNGANLDPGSGGRKLKKGIVPSPNPCSTRTSRKKMKVDWTPDLHKRFVKAVEQLGINLAIPSKILELMKVDGLTRHNVASHLQKYRMHKRHVLPKEDELSSRRIWRQQQRDPMQSGYAHKPIMSFPPYQSNCGLPTGQIYPVWGYPSNMHSWGHPGYPVWQPIHHGMHADAWGCPVVQAPNPYSFYPPTPLPFHGSDFGEGYSNEAWMRNSLDHFPAEEVIDTMLREATSKPWLPLPLGLKPPSTESVLVELQKQGITRIPPTTCPPKK